MASSLLCLFVTTSMLAAEENWPQFRGPNGDGVAASADPPIHWSETRNVAWKVRLPGRGRSSPVVLGNRIWVTTAYETPAGGEETEKRLRGHPMPGDMDLATRVVLAVVCLDRSSGKRLYEAKLFDVDKPPPVHKLNSYATPTPVVETGRVYCDFGALGTACLEAETGRHTLEEATAGRPPGRPRQLARVVQGHASAGA